MADGAPSAGEELYAESQAKFSVRGSPETKPAADAPPVTEPMPAIDEAGD